MFVSKTTNGGTDWTRYYLSPVGFAYAIAVDPSNSDIVYAGGNPGLFKTTNSGADWIDISAGITGFIYSLAIDPSATSTVYAGTPNGVFKSTNAGTSWTNTGCSNVNAIVIDPDAPDIIYAGTRTGVFRSITGGGNWIAVNQGFEDSTVMYLGIDPNNYLFAGTDGTGMYRWSLDVGIAEQNSDINRLIALSIRPNPSTGRVRLEYNLSQEAMIKLSVFDVQGRLVKKLPAQVQKSGMYTLYWDGLNENGDAVPSGVYLYRLCIDDAEHIHKSVLLR